MKEPGRDLRSPLSEEPGQLGRSPPPPPCAQTPRLAGRLWPPRPPAPPPPPPAPPPLLLPPHHHKVACSYQDAPQFLMWSVPHALRLFFTLPLALINLVLFSLAFVQRQASLGSGESRPGVIYHLNSGNGGLNSSFFATATAKVCARPPNWKKVAPVLIAPP